jgi:hypothetical protein
LARPLRGGLGSLSSPRPDKATPETSRPGAAVQNRPPPTRSVAGEVARSAGGAKGEGDEDARPPFLRVR